MTQNTEYTTRRDRIAGMGARRRAALSVSYRDGAPYSGVSAICGMPCSTICARSVGWKRGATIRWWIDALDVLGQVSAVKPTPCRSPLR